MAIKVYFKNQIHRFAKLPENLKALIAHINTLFKDELPSSWTIQYLDSEGDSIVVSHDHDFKELLELESSTPNSTLKLYIVPTEGIAPSMNVSSQNHGEKTVTADNVTNDLPQKIEDQPQVVLQPKNEGENSKQFERAKKLTKLLLKRGDNQEIINELNAIKQTLTEEEIQRLEQKKIRFQERFVMKGFIRGGHHGHHSHHGHHGHHGYHGYHGHQAHFGHHEKSPEGFGFRFKYRIPEGSDKEASENPFMFFKVMKTFRKYWKAQKKGNTEKANKKKEKLLKSIPEEHRKSFEATLDSMNPDLEKEALKQKFTEAIEQYVEFCHPERKDEILEKLKAFREKKHFFKAKFGSRDHSFEKKGCDGKQKFLGFFNKEYCQLHEDYSGKVIKKAATLKLVFPQEEMKNLCEYVLGKPQEMSVEDLVVNFRK